MTNLICICCPKGCHLCVDEENKAVSGNSCPRGKEYGLNEVINPTRILTSTVKITGGALNRLPVKTNKPIPKGMIFEVMNELIKCEVSSPINRGDIIIKNVLGTGSDIIACRSL